MSWTERSRLQSRTLNATLAVIVFVGTACAPKATVVHDGPLPLPRGRAIEQATIRLHDRSLDFWSVVRSDPLMSMPITLTVTTGY